MIYALNFAYSRRARNFMNHNANDWTDTAQNAVFAQYKPLFPGYLLDPFYVNWN